MKIKLIFLSIMIFGAFFFPYNSWFLFSWKMFAPASSYEYKLILKCEGKQIELPQKENRFIYHFEKDLITRYSKQVEKKRSLDNISNYFYAYLERYCARPQIFIYKESVKTKQSLIIWKSHE